ncbi:hypothetical protein B0H13DRAFT_2366238 [Mycena leptocephala]|nr:hypothetical protein B0H13DRAFT_2366238 [Mycena leptocephala]
MPHDTLRCLSTVRYRTTSASPNLAPLPLLLALRCTCSPPSAAAALRSRVALLGSRSVPLSLPTHTASCRLRSVGDRIREGELEGQVGERWTRAEAREC